MITFQQEKWADCVAEMREIWPEHYAALALDKDQVALACDEAKYEAGEAMGCLHIVTARADGKIIGYFYGMLMIHLHYKFAGLMCYSDVYYMKPEYRANGGAGARFIAAIKQSVKERGAIKLYMSTKVHADNGALFEAMGMRLTDKVYTVLL